MEDGEKKAVRVHVRVRVCWGGGGGSSRVAADQTEHDIPREMDTIQRRNA